MWDFFIIFVAFINGVTLPLEVAFQQEFDKLDVLSKDGDWKWKNFFLIINYVSMVIFLIDILVAFLTSYLDIMTGDEIMELGKIAKNYLSSGGFLLDIVSTFPLKHWGRIIGVSKMVESILVVFGLLKFQRIFRARKIISNLDTTVEMKSLLTLLYITVLLLIIFHLMACIFFASINVDTGTDNQWVPQTDYMYGSTKLHEAKLSKKYLSMLYHAIMIFGLNEVGPQTSDSLYVVICLMLVSAMVNANVFGEIAVLVSELDKKEVEL